ncbi:acetoacetate decarboxylase family protein [Gloeocapsopsis dulcis]|uniref:Acetoacetate decarboxylase n=1 Tax=Gloeocapsopsis dulcis AAB1 = 1H9 TaxID=1433147 RepID=A0A6N8FRG2_9CHRO|nr:acetoacetate decarboxylase family protein [Gloeocapsopsis dulcis]MUL35182.1 acetoacetate decarboxylase [Gloeocapsopsis dulcis AAB1 = 1H9]WNN89067.1 acetoacetate decarboxylase family protein [Gloeocapsopsis dulcis]
MALYPQAPWTLQGSAVATLHLIDIERVRSLIPQELDIISVFPGKTVGGVYLSNYSTGSVLQYSELIVVAAAVTHSEIGGWVSHIYVDNPDSVAGGREIWGLPKELAEFTWEKNSVSVRQSDCTLCTLNYNSLFSIGWKPRLGASSFSSKNSELLSFACGVEAQFGLANAQLTVPTTSPFTDLIIGQPWLAISATQMHLTVDAPQVLTKKR